MLLLFLGGFQISPKERERERTAGIPDIIILIRTLTTAKKLGKKGGSWGW
jgi:hypothetical protein